MLFQSTHKFLGISCLGGFVLLSTLSPFAVLAQSTTPVKAGTYALKCTNISSEKTVSEYSANAETGVIFFSRYLFVNFDNAVVPSYAPIFYPSTSVSGVRAVLNTSGSSVYNINAGKIAQSGLVGKLQAVYYPSGSTKPKLRTASIDLQKASCGSPQPVTPPSPPTNQPTSDALPLDPQSTTYTVDIPGLGAVTVEPDGTVTIPDLSTGQKL
jgi:hypothetical protein